jgi:hexosaminidase
MRTFKKNLVLLLFLIFLATNANADNRGIIPLPEEFVSKPGKFTFNEKTSIYVQPSDSMSEFATEVFRKQFAMVAGYTLPLVKKPKASNIIICKLNASIKSIEGYSLNISPAKILIEARSAVGIFYAFQSLQQLLPVDFESRQKVQSPVSWSVQAGVINDSPRFAYRGLMLDVGRHFMPKEFVMKLIDMMAYHKLNYFHWHLTEDQGWRIEIKKYPKLTEIGSVREKTLAGHNKERPRKWNLNPHAGFYTQDDIREVIRYAQKRFITIIPEIEMPGHSVAALSAYPEFSCTGGPFEVPGTWGVFNDIYCTKDATFKFLQDILDEVTALFPGEYIHIGGDEAPKVRWKNCVHCQQTMAKNGLHDEEALQNYFILKMADYLKAKGKKVIGWDEVLEGGELRDVTVMSWRGEKGGIAAAKKNLEVIMSPNSYLYFDYYQGPRETEPVAIGGLLPLEKVYSYKPVPEGFTPTETALIKGIQANVWTEYMTDERKVEYMIFPRIAALAEVAWTKKEDKNYNDFLVRLKNLTQRYDLRGINFRKQ